MREPTRGFLSGTGLALLLMAGTWFAPLEFETASSKARTMIGVFNTVFQPMIDLAGKGPLLGILGTVAIVCLAFGIGLRLPALPRVRPDLSRSRRERPEPEETDDQPATVRRRCDFSALAAAEQAPPSVLPEIPPRPEEQVDEASPDIEPHTAGGGAQIPDIRRQGEELAVFLENFAGLTAGRAPAYELGGEEISLLEEVLNEVRARFPDLRPMGMPSGLDDLRNLCIRRMVTGEAEALAALPDDMLAFVNEGYRLSSQDPHQMFGLAGVKQCNLYDHLSDLLLLQLSYDDVNEWRFGDMGLWHFWISPEDAAAGRWDKAELTFECS